jgi:Family of unknown function (DUF5996)
MSTARENAWPSLSYPEWSATIDTLHMWTQIVGKVKLELTPFLNDWWNVTFRVSARGLTTSLIPIGTRAFEVNFDFIDHRLRIEVSDGTSRSMQLGARSVGDFYEEFMAHLVALGIDVKINTQPMEVDDGIRFAQDSVHGAYDPDHVNRWWRVLLGTNRVLERYRTTFVGKSSPVQFWWGSFDLATSRYSGRRATPRKWPARWMELAGRDEQALAGFWPGNQRFPEAAFVAYTTPEPPGCRISVIQPDAAYFHPELAEFVLPYARVREEDNPEQLILDFYRSTYEVGATLGGWDREALERPDPTRRPQGRPASA